MRVLVLVAAVIVGSAAVTFAQDPGVQLIPSKAKTTLTLTTSTPVVQALGVVAGDFGIACEFDDRIPAEDLNRDIVGKLKAIRLVDLRFEEAMKFLASQAGLTYRAIDAKTVRFEKKR